MNFFETLENLCAENNTNVTAVLKTLGYSTSKGTAWHNGSIPTGDILLKIAQYFGVSVDYLLGYTPENEENPRLQKLIEFASRLTDEQLDGFIESYSKLLDSIKK